MWTAKRSPAQVGTARSSCGMRRAGNCCGLSAATATPFYRWRGVGTAKRLPAEVRTARSNCGMRRAGNCCGLSAATPPPSNRWHGVGTAKPSPAEVTITRFKLWDAPSGQLLRTLSGHSSAVLSVAWSADSKTLASGSFDETIQAVGRVERATAADSPRPLRLRLVGGVECGRQNARHRK
ncbi:hypothetical protein SBA4_5120007 [Candidatus Sulfopaludibacter sp. SbA4]|nr:hypothetical protein SBA4_5120007 [Candidatus Sulfopaludibacter sp. SbA4]